MQHRVTRNRPRSQKKANHILVRLVFVSSFSPVGFEPINGRSALPAVGFVVVKSGKVAGPAVAFARVCAAAPRKRLVFQATPSCVLPFLGSLCWV